MTGHVAFISPAYMRRLPYLWEDDTTQILNFPTKLHWKANSKLEYIEAGLKYIAENYQDLGLLNLALPPLGCGNGGLNWPDVRPLIAKYLGNIPDLDVYVYEPLPAASMKSEDGQRGRSQNARPIAKSAASEESM